MSNGPNEGTNPNPTPDAGQQPNPAAGQQQEAPKYTPPASQADLDRIVESRLARERQKYADYDDLKAKATKFDEAEQSNKTELQKALEAAAAAEKRATAAEASNLRATVAAAKGVPANLLTGTTEAELNASADALVAFRGQTAKVPPVEGSGGNVHDTQEKSADDVVKAALGR